MGKGVCNFWNGYAVNITFFILGVVGIFLRGDIYGSQFLYDILMVYLIVSSTVGILNNYKGGSICPRCKKSMLSLDNPQVLTLIKKLDLQLGDNSTKLEISEQNSQEPHKTPES